MLWSWVTDCSELIPLSREMIVVSPWSATDLMTSGKDATHGCDLILNSELSM